MNSSWLIRRALRIVVAAIGSLPAFSLQAQVPDQDSDMVARDPIMVRLEGLSDANLKLFYLHCSRAAKRSLGTGGVAVCSVGYELLLQRTFGGDFNALLAWSRRHPDDGTDIELEDGELIGNELPQLP